MTGFRVTVTAGNATSIANIEATSNRLAQLQQEVSSGKQINTPSDNPAGTVQAMQLNAAISRNTQYSTNSSDAIAWLSTADSTYSQVVAQLQQARTLVVQGLNTGTGDATSNAAIATQLSGIRSSLLALANTSYNGRPVFGGTTAGGSAYDGNGDYVGDNGSVSRQIGAQATVSVSATGPTVFGADDASAGTSSVFTLLNNFAQALTTNPSTLSSTALGQLDSAISTVSTAQAVEGSTYKQVQTAQSTQTTTGTALQTQLSSVQDVDMAKAAVQLSSANISYQAALQTTASIHQMSLLNFLQ